MQFKDLANLNTADTFTRWFGIESGSKRKQLAVVVFAVLVLVNISACTSLFFYPDKTLVRTPAAFALDYEDVYLSTRDDVRLHAWWIQPPSTPIGRVLFLHGNAENISTHIASVLWLLEAGYQVFALDYRGYGQSYGIPDVPYVFEDIRSAAQWMSSQKDVGPNIIFGQSLGASLSFGALNRFPKISAGFDAVVSEAAFSEYDQIAREVAGSTWLTWPFSYPASWLIKSTYDPVNIISNIDIPIVLVHSVDDDVIGIHHAHQLYKAANEPKQLIETIGKHIQATNNEPVRQRLLDFFNALH